MTPEEKAKELVDKMFKNCRMTIAGANTLWMPLAKKQAIIVCDEMLDFNADNFLLSGQAQEYWRAVKEAIKIK